MSERGVLPSRLRHARNVAGLNQADVAAALFISQQRYASWEAGTIPPAKHHAALAEALGLELVTLLGWIADAYRERDEAKGRELAEARRDNGRLVDYIEEQSEKAEQRAQAIEDLMQRVEETLSRTAVTLDELTRGKTRNR